MNIKVRFTILALVFVISTVFFWLAINGALQRSKAQQASDFQIIPHAQELECNPEGECWLHILGSTADGNTVAGVSGVIRYGENLTPDRVDHLGICATSSYDLNQELEFTPDPQSHSLRFAVGALEADANLKGGNGCVATIVFKPTDIQQDPQETVLALVAQEWKAGGIIGGKRDVFNVQVDGTQIKVKIDSTVPWPPEGEPSVTPSIPPTECQLDKGDCNCDGNIDLIDRELIRATQYNEGSSSCSATADSWLRNNDLVKPVVIENE